MEAPSFRDRVMGGPYASFHKALMRVRHALESDTEAATFINDKCEENVGDPEIPNR